MNRILPILIIFGIGLLIALPVLAVEYQLEVQYPPFGGVSPGGGPASWVRYIFFLALALTSIAAVGSLIWAGIVWMTSASSERISNAKKQIWAAVGGIILVAGSVVILRTINPDIVSLRQPTIESIEEGFRYQYGRTCTNDSDCQPRGTCDRLVGRCVEGGPGSRKENYQWVYLFIEPPGQRPQYCGDDDVLGRNWTNVDDRFCASQPRPADRVGHRIQCCGFTQPKNP